jgi:hypothetical protein
LQFFEFLVHKIHALMIHDLGADFARPKQQIRQCVANLVLRKFCDMRDFFLSLSTTADCFAYAVSGRKFAQHSGDATR